MARAARVQTLVQLDETLLSVLDERAAQRGVSRSHLIHEAITNHLASDLARDISAQIVAGYERIPQSIRARRTRPTSIRRVA